MILAIPADKQNLEAKNCISFGRAPFFLIYNLETGEPRFVVNQAVDSPGGAGIEAAQSLVDENVDVLLTPRCGQNAAEVLEAADIAIYKTKDVSLEENIRLYTAGELEVLSEIHKGFHGVPQA